MLGKDFFTGFICVAFFLTRYPCRIVTTSAKAQHLSVLWGEIGWFIQNSKVPLTYDRGGPLICNQREIKRMWHGEQDPVSYIKGMVASMEAIASMQGHHVKQTGDRVPRTLFAVDEASSVPDDYHSKARTWANRILVLGNTWPCENFFNRAVDGGGKDPGGDVPGPDGTFYRRVIRIEAEDSPNVRYARAELAAGLTPTDTIIVPGVKPWSMYVREMATWDEIQKSVSHRARFWKGGELLMFPEAVWQKCEAAAAALPQDRQIKALGIDSGQGVANTSWAGADELGLLHLESAKTADTDVIPEMTIDIGRRLRVPAERWLFDPGGGGRQHVDTLRRKGYNARLVAFGGPPTNREPRRVRGVVPLSERQGKYDATVSFKDKRAQLFGELMFEMANGWAIPSEYATILIPQLGRIPKRWVDGGKLMLLPKTAPPGAESLVKLIGFSPDEADAVALALHGVLHPNQRTRVGALGRG